MIVGRESSTTKFNENEEKWKCRFVLLSGSADVNLDRIRRDPTDDDDVDDEGSTVVSIIS